MQQEWQGLPYLTCNLLEDWSHGFFTRHYYPQTPIPKGLLTRKLSKRMELSPMLPVKGFGWPVLTVRPY